MKKLNLILAIFFVFLISCNANNKRNSLKEDKLKREVKITTELRYRASEKYGQPQKGELSSKKIKKYNDDGNIIEEKQYWPNGEFMWKKIYEYDELGNKTGKVYRNNDEVNIRFVLKFTCDKNGNLAEINEFNSDGEKISRTLYKIDIKGRVIEETVYKNNIFNEKNFRSYEDSNKEVIKYFNSDSVLQVIFTNKYDENGNLVEQNAINSINNSKTNIIYQYDDFDKIGNWKKQIIIRDGVVENIIDREIEYFDTEKNTSENSEKNLSDNKINQLNTERNSDDKFTGTWKYDDQDNRRFKISKMGDIYLLEGINGDVTGGGSDGIYTLTKEGILKSNSGFMAIAYDKENKQLILNVVRCTKVDNN